MVPPRGGARQSHEPNLQVETGAFFCRGELKCLLSWSGQISENSAGIEENRIIPDNIAPEEWLVIKRTFRRFQGIQKNAWLERVLLRNLILDSGWMSEEDLDSAVQQGMSDPVNLRLTEEWWADSDKKLAQMGLSNRLPHRPAQ